MKEEFVCTIDHAKFSSKEALVNHLLKKYSITQEEGTDSSDILKKLREAFPDAEIEITNRRIDLSFPELNSNFEFRIGVLEEDDFFGPLFFDSIDSAVSHYQQLLEIKDEIISSVKEKFNAESVTISQIFEAELGSDGSDSISFSFVVNGKTYHHRYEFEGMDKLLRSLDGYFITKVEGECFADYSRYDATNTFYVDGVDIRELAVRAKKMRVEILE